MQKDEKNKLKDNIWLRQLLLVLIILLWVFAILFKNQMNGTLRIFVLIGLLLFSLLGVYWINRAFFAVGKKKK